jgi:hypothetical protein
MRSPPVRFDCSIGHPKEMPFDAFPDEDLPVNSMANDYKITRLITNCFETIAAASSVLAGLSAGRRRCQTRFMEMDSSVRHSARHREGCLACR